MLDKICSKIIMCMCVFDRPLTIIESIGILLRSSNNNDRTKFHKN